MEPRLDRLKSAPYVVVALALIALVGVVAQDKTAIAQVGMGVVIATLLGAFLLFYRRSVRAREAAEDLARENERLWSISREEALTDALTGLGNRRALNRDLRHAIAAADESEHELVLAIFDLNGFKLYNDTFGHGAGDGLLSRLGGRLRKALGDAGTAYRMGGDEFCVLASCTPARAQELFAVCGQALSESGSGWAIDCCCGTAWITSEADTPAAAMRIADQRMYAGKTTRSSASRELNGVLRQILAETSEHLCEHSTRVAELAGAVTRQLGLPANECDRIAQAAQLHDVGKTAVPVEILEKPGPLTADEWAFIHHVPLVSERIMMSSATLASAASLVRSTHERVDGTGYPDRLSHDQIPLGARVIAVCDAFDALTSARPYRAAVSRRDALEELRRCAGSQLDPDLVDALVRVLAGRDVGDDQRSLSRSAS